MKIHPALQSFDPRAVGFKCGLEVHQQLDTRHKLFCKCPVLPYSDEYHAEVLRHMRPTLSELGEYDGTALMEFKTHKEIIYRLNKKSVCTYEMDDTPPFPINPQAVDIAIEIALMLNCTIVDELHVIRKQYLDGSIPAGFQRTAIVGISGWIPVGNRKVRVRQLSLEEDACREVSDNGHLRVYLADRLSIPLIEVVTEPDILHPDEADEVGWQIGRLLRATGKIRRGIGRVRQDVNVSVEGSTRIEIKGVPRIPIIPRLVHYEAYRQHRLLGLRELMLARGITKDNLKADRYDLTGKLRDCLPENSNELTAGAIVLRKMGRLLTHPIGPHRTFADDISGRVRVIACLTGSPVLRHTDSASSFTDQDREIITSNTGLTEQDVAILVFGSAQDVKTALNEVEIRCREAAVGIPNETRQAKASGETDFERILPGPDRMYPDTDSPPLAISRDRVQKIKDQLHEAPWSRIARYKEIDLPEHTIEALVDSNHADLFDSLITEYKIDPGIASGVIIDLFIHYRRLGGKEDILTAEAVTTMFKLFTDNKISREAFRLILEHSARNSTLSLTESISALGFLSDTKIDIDLLVTDAIKTLESCPLNLIPDRQFDIVMGEVMKTIRGKIASKKIVTLVDNHLSKHIKSGKKTVALWMDK